MPINFDLSEEEIPLAPGAFGEEIPQPHVYPDPLKADRLGQATAAGITVPNDKDLDSELWGSLQDEASNEHFAAVNKEMTKALENADPNRVQEIMASEDYQLSMNRNRFMLERLASDQIAADSNEEVRSRTFVNMMLSNAIEDYELQVDQQGTVGKAVDFISDFAGGGVVSKVRTYGTDASNELLGVASVLANSSNRKEQAETLEKFIGGLQDTSALIGENPQRVLDNLRNLQSVVNDSFNITDVNSQLQTELLVEVGSALAGYGVGKAVKAAKAVHKADKAAMAAAPRLDNTINAVKNGSQVSDDVASATAHELNIYNGTVGSPANVQAMSLREEAGKLVDQFRSDLDIQSGVVDRATRVQEVTDDLAKSTMWGKEPTHVRPVYDRDQVVFDMYWGKLKDGSSFKTIKAANNAAARMGQGFEVEEVTKGEWLVKKRIVDQDKYQSGVFAQDNPNLLGTLNNTLLSADEEVLGQAVDLHGSTARFRNEFNEVLTRNMSKLGGSDKEKFNTIAAAMRENEKWLSETEFKDWWNVNTGSYPSQKVLDAYGDYRVASDTIFNLKNSVTRLQKSQNGLREVTLPNGFKAEAKVNDLHTSGIRGVVYDSRTTAARNAGEFSPVDLQDLRKQNYVAVQFDEPTKLADGKLYDSVLIKRSDIKEDALNLSQVGYIEGGSVLYDKMATRWFVKGTRKTTDAMGAERFLKPSVFGAATGRKEAQRMLNNILEQQSIVKKYRDGLLSKVEADNAIVEINSRFDDVEEVGKWLDESGVGTDGVPSIVRDRELPEEYRANGVEFTVYGTDNVVTNTPSNAYRSRKFNKSRSSERVQDLAGNTVRMVSPLETLDKAFDDLLPAALKEQYGNRQKRQWIDTYGKYFKATGQTVDEQFEGVARTNLTKEEKKIARQAEKFRDIIKMHAGAESKTDRLWNAFADKLDEWVLDRTTNPADSYFRHIPLEGIREYGNPAKLLPRLAYYLTLGMYNPKTFLQNAVVIATLGAHVGAKNAFKTYAILSPMRMAWHAGRDDVARLAAQRTKKLTGLAESEFMAIYRLGKDSGYFNIRGNQMITRMANRNLYSGTGVTGKVVRNQGMFFEEAELWNRMSSLIAAKLERPTASRTQLLGRAEVLSGGTSTASRALWQNEAWAIPFQFYSFPMRILENMTGKKLTQAQKLKYTLLATGMFGTQTIDPGLMREFFPSTMDDETLAKAGYQLQENTILASIANFADSGLFDSAFEFTLEAATGQDVETAFGTRASAFTYIQDTIDKVQDENFLEVLGGVSSSVLVNTFKNTGRIIYGGVANARYAAAQDGLTMYEGNSPFGKEDLIDLASSASTFSTAYKLWLAWSHGQSYSLSSFSPGYEVAKPEAVAEALGIPLQQAVAGWDLFRDKKSRDAIVKDSAKQIGRTLNQARLADSEGDYAQGVRLRLKARALRGRLISGNVSDKRFANDLNREVRSIMSRDKDFTTYATQKWLETGER